MKRVLITGVAAIVLLLVVIRVTNDTTSTDEVPVIITLNGKEFMMGQSPTDKLLDEFIICYTSQENLKKDLEFNFATEVERDEYLKENRHLIENADNITDAEYTAYVEGYEKNTDRLHFGGNLASDPTQHMSIMLKNNGDTHTDIYGTEIVGFLIISEEINCSINNFIVGQELKESDLFEFSSEEKESGEVSYIKSSGRDRLELVTVNGIIEQIIVNYLFVEG